MQAKGAIAGDAGNLRHAIERGVIASGRAFDNLGSKVGYLKQIPTAHIHTLSGCVTRLFTATAAPDNVNVCQDSLAVESYKSHHVEITVLDYMSKTKACVLKDYPDCVQPATDSEAARHRAKRRATQDRVAAQQQAVEEVPILGGLGSGERLIGLAGGDGASGAAQLVVPLLGATMQQAAAMDAAMSAKPEAAAAAGKSEAAAVGDGEAARHAAHRAAQRAQPRWAYSLLEGVKHKGRWSEDDPGWNVFICFVKASRLFYRGRQDIGKRLSPHAWQAARCQTSNGYIKTAIQRVSLTL